MTTEFKINERMKIIGKTQNTRNGFRHLVEFYRDDKLIESRSVSYLNRTWESYNYETAISNLLKKMVKNRDLTQDEAKQIKIRTKDIAHGNINREMGTLSAIASLGDVFGKTKKEKNDWKKRMLSTQKGMSFPDNWDSLSEDEKEKRLDGAIKQMKVKI